MSISAVCFIGILTAVFSLTIRRHNSEAAFFITVAGSILIFLSVLLNISSLFETVKNIFSAASVEQAYIIVLLKAIGLCFLCEFAVDCCIDAGQRALANNISIAGKVLVLVTALPLYKDVLSNVLSLTGGNL